MRKSMHVVLTILLILIMLFTSCANHKKVIPESEYAYYEEKYAIPLKGFPLYFPTAEAWSKYAESFELVQAFCYLNESYHLYDGERLWKIEPIELDAVPGCELNYLIPASAIVETIQNFFGFDCTEALKKRTAYYDEEKNGIYKSTLDGSGFANYYDRVEYVYKLGTETEICVRYYLPGYWRFYRYVVEENKTGFKIVSMKELSKEDLAENDVLKASSEEPAPQEVRPEDLTEPSSAEVNYPILYTEEDQAYFEKYAKELAMYAPRFSDPNEMEPDRLIGIFTRIHDAYENDDHGSVYLSEDGLYHVPLADVVDVLNRYLGEDYSEKVQQDFSYNVKTQCFDLQSFDGIGGGNDNIVYPAPIRREGNCVAVPFYCFNKDYSEIISGTECVIEEYDGGFYVRRIANLTQEQIDALNKKYCGGK